MRIKSFLRQNIFRIILILIMLGTLSYFFIHLANQGQLAQTFLVFSSSSVVFLVLSFLFMVLSLFIKAFRFFILVRPAVDILSFRTFLIPFFVGYGFSTLGPLKSGEIVSIEINKRSVSVPRSASLAAIAFFRVLDMFIILIFFIIAMISTIPRIISHISLTNPTQASTMQTLSQIIFYAAIFGTLVLSIILFFPPFGRFCLKVLKAITAKFSSRAEKWLEEVITPFLEQYYDSLKILYKEKTIALIVSLTSLSRWVLEFYSLVFTLKAFGVSLTFIDAASITSLTLLAGLVTPAGLGTGTITSQALLEGLKVNPDITGASIIFQTLVGTGLTLSVAAITSIFLKDYRKEIKRERDTSNNNIIEQDTK
ncbi:MAG: lysylphosphatidylglycerol synthase transmembrane domain-containing protein [Candidatus Heimdallarchaeaceae archaeon]